MKLILNLFRIFLKKLLLIDEKFQSFVEEKNIYWMDDYPLVNTLLLKVIKELNRKQFGEVVLF